MRFCLLLSAFASVASAEAKWEEVTTAKYPDADIVTVDEIERVEYTPDGRSESIEESWTKLLTEKGRREESVQRLDYSKRYGEARFEYVGAIGTNGVERAIDVSATTKESTDNGSMASNIYDPLDRVITCTVPDLKVGEILHVKTVRRIVKSRVKDQWSDCSIFEWSHPVLKSVYEVKAPAERPVLSKAILSPLGNVTETAKTLEDGSTLHTFVATNSPQAFPEPDMPPLWTQVERVQLSTAASWRELSKWYWDVSLPHLVKTNADMRAKVDEIVAAAGTNRMAQLRGIFRFVSQEVRYMGLTLEDTAPGYAPHDVDITFDNRYGVCRDKAGLLVAMLRLGGFEAYPVLINVGAKMEKSVPQAWFNHAIAAVANFESGSKDKYLLLDPTNENTTELFPPYLCNSSYIVCCPQGEDLALSPVPPPEKNAIEVTTTGTLGRDGMLVLDSWIAFRGINDLAYRAALLRGRPEDRERILEKALRRVAPSAELVHCEITPKDLQDTETPLDVRLVSRVADAVLHGDTTDVLNVPMVSRSLGIVNMLLGGSTSLEKRKYPLVVDTTALVRERAEIDVDDALGSIVELPPKARGGDGYDYSISYVTKNGKLVVERSQALSAVEFDPEAYLKLRERIKALEAADRRRPAFAADRAFGADVHVLLDSTETRIASDREWVTTNAVVKRVMTYSGKRRTAEVKIPYNPSWKSVELVSAVVSNRGGRVAAVTPKEVNVMDASWTSAAPRYPAGKILVVTLPSVEIDSVIAMTFATTVTNAPAPYHATHFFDATDPTDEKRVTVDGWSRVERNLRRLPSEVAAAKGVLWRDAVTIAKDDFAKTAAELAEAADPPAYDAAAVTGVAGGGDPEATLREIRDWMAKHVRVSGPGLYDVPFAEQLTDAATVFKERYATRFDYVRAMCAALRGAGLEAEIVLAAEDADDSEAERRRDLRDYPNARAFDQALCRVKIREGGFCGFGGTEKTIFVGTDNEYSELGATVFAGADYLDPKDGSFGIVTVPRPELLTAMGETNAIVVRANGAIDLDHDEFCGGPAVGAMRKRYAEMLPEDRSRHYQAILGTISEAASSTRELETDVKGYPATLRFSCFVPDYATSSAGTLSLVLPGVECPFPDVTGGGARVTPVGFAATEACESVWRVKFPDGYTVAEHLPAPYVIADPVDPSKKWFECQVSYEVKDNALEVVVRHVTYAQPYTWGNPPFAELVKAWRRTILSRANLTVSARRP